MAPPDRAHAVIMALVTAVAQPYFELIKPLLRRVAPEHVAIVDSAELTAREVARQLPIEPLPSSAYTSSDQRRSEQRGVPGLKFFATDSAEQVVDGRGRGACGFEGIGGGSRGGHVDGRGRPSLHLKTAACAAVFWAPKLFRHSLVQYKWKLTSTLICTATGLPSL